MSNYKEQSQYTKNEDIIPESTAASGIFDELENPNFVEIGKYTMSENFNTYLYENLLIDLFEGKIDDISLPVLNYLVYISKHYAEIAVPIEERVSKKYNQ